MLGRESKPRRPLANIEDVKDAVKAFCVIYHTSRMYQTDHVVFKSAVEERMPLIQRVLRDGKSLSLDFHENQVWYAGTPLEPGSSVFQRISQEFGSLGIRNLTMLPSLDADDLTRLISVIIGQADAIRKDGLAAVLKRERIKTVHSVDTPLHRGRPETGERAASRDAKIQVSDGPSKTGGGGVWDISDVDTDDMGASRDMAAEDDGSLVQPRPLAMKKFVSGVLGALARQEADLKQAVDILATEFEHRIEERVAVVRRESEKKIRRLETVKELVLTELERLQIAAVIMDTDFQVVAANALARKLLEGVGGSTGSSPLEAFVRSGSERQDICLGKEERTARLVTVAPTGSGSEIMLITLEKK